MTTPTNSTRASLRGSSVTRAGWSPRSSSSMTRTVLMVGYMNDEALRRTLTTGRVTFWSRSRQEYWRKGDTSGHVQYVKSLALDCDGDAILVQVDQVGAACHTGKRSCFEEGGPLPVVVGNRTAEQENA